MPTYLASKSINSNSHQRVGVRTGLPVDVKGHLQVPLGRNSSIRRNSTPKNASISFSNLLSLESENPSVPERPKESANQEKLQSLLSKTDKLLQRAQSYKKAPGASAGRDASSTASVKASITPPRQTSAQKTLNSKSAVALTDAPPSAATTVPKGADGKATSANGAGAGFAGNKCGARNKEDTSSSRLNVDDATSSFRVTASSLSSSPAVAAVEAASRQAAAVAAATPVGSNSQGSAAERGAMTMEKIASSGTATATTTTSPSLSTNSSGVAVNGLGRAVTGFVQNGNSDSNGQSSTINSNSISKANTVTSANINTDIVNNRSNVSLGLKRSALSDSTTTATTPEFNFTTTEDGGSLPKDDQSYLGGSNRGWIDDHSSSYANIHHSASPPGRGGSRSAVGERVEETRATMEATPRRQETEREPQLQRERRGAMPKLFFNFNEAVGTLELPSELELNRQESLINESESLLPPLESLALRDLTSAATPPTAGGGGGASSSAESVVATAADTLTVPATSSEVTAAVEAASSGAVAAQSAAAKDLDDGMGKLADGSWYEKRSGVDRNGEFGYEKRWTLIRGRSADKRLVWEECWWEASDRRGFRELGAVKSGGDAATGAAWRETWTEKMGPRLDRPEHLFIERSAHKWARQGRDAREQWEERWGEAYDEAGAVNKYAEKWARAGNDVWHEKWGEDYDTSRGWCKKYTDKWAERLSPSTGRAVELWGDKWVEDFCDGKGEKHGEVWSISREDVGGDAPPPPPPSSDPFYSPPGPLHAAADGGPGSGTESGSESGAVTPPPAPPPPVGENPITQEYHRWWNEEHFGGGGARKWGESTAGEHWDTTDHNAETYYNPVPHFGFQLALAHSPRLREVPLPAPRESVGLRSHALNNADKKKMKKKKTNAKNGKEVQDGSMSETPVSGSNRAGVAGGPSGSPGQAQLLGKGRETTSKTVASGKEASTVSAATTVATGRAGKEAEGKKGEKLAPNASINKPDPRAVMTLESLFGGGRQADLHNSASYITDGGYADVDGPGKTKTTAVDAVQTVEAAGPVKEKKAKAWEDLLSENDLTLDDGRPDDNRVYDNEVAEDGSHDDEVDDEDDGEEEANEEEEERSDDDDNDELGVGLSRL